MNVSSVKNLNGEVFSAVQDASLTNVVQTNSAQWGQGGGAISSYTSSWTDDVQPYGDFVINTLNEKYISSLISNSANSAKFAYNSNSANSANYAETVNETYLENKGFARNLSSEYGTVSIIHNNIIESTNSAISRVGNEGFVSSYGGESSVGDSKPATYTWDKSLPNTTITLDMGWSNGETLTYSANTDLTGEIVLPTGTSTQTIDIPNATEIKVWTSYWLSIENAVVSAADSFETVVGELAWTSALPTYEYDSTNKISAINGSAIAGGGDVPVSANEAIQYVQTKSGTIDDTINNVTTNSGVWGGSALPISAGPGIKVNFVDNTLVFSNDETLLWSGSGTSITSFTVFEPLTNFKEVAFYVTPLLSNTTSPVKVTIPMVGSNTSNLSFTFNSTWLGFTGINFTYSYNQTGMSSFNLSTAGWFGYNLNGASTGSINNLYGYKIIGINRVSGGN